MDSVTQQSLNLDKIQPSSASSKSRYVTVDPHHQQKHRVLIVNQHLDKLILSNKNPPTITQRVTSPLPPTKILPP